MLIVSSALGTASVRADEGAPLGSMGELREACREAREPGRRALYVVDLGRYRFARAGQDFLPIDTDRNLSAFDGAAALFPAGLEPMGFRAGAERQTALRRARQAGARLRVGFFLGFDGVGQPCVLRSTVAVSTIRMDVAFVELVDSRGRVIARDDTERLRAWQDDVARDHVPGSGPRVAVEDAWGTRGGEVALAVRAAAPALGRCHAEQIARGGSPSGRVLVRLEASGPVVAFTTFEDERFSACVVRSLGQVSGGGATIPLRFVAD